MNKNNIMLRMDDVGASSKEFCVYSNKLNGLGNYLFLKYLPHLKAWGRYREIVSDEWDSIFDVLCKNQAVLTVAVTASWVESDGTLIPIQDKFEKQVMKLRDGVKFGLIKIANHGLTHCVLRENLYLPHLFKSNRKYHREFWDWLPREIHFHHIEVSQKILDQAFGQRPEVFVPPGNVYSLDTLDAAVEYGIKTVNCNTSDYEYKGINVKSNKDVIDFHDKDIVESGVQFLEKIINKHKNKEFNFIK